MFIQVSQSKIGWSLLYRVPDTLYHLTSFMHFFYQVEKDKLLMKVLSARSGQPWDEIDNAEEKKVR